MGCLKLSYHEKKSQLKVVHGSKFFDGKKKRVDYYPGGMQMPGRSYSSTNQYRYGFNGKEKDKDISTTTDYDYGFRIYSPALGRFLSVDPLTKKYPALTPYQFASNTPIQAVDLDGLESKIVINQTQKDNSLIQVASENFIVTQKVLGVEFTTDNSGVLGHGTYTVTYSSDGKSFTENWKPDAGNSTEAFAASGVNSERWGNNNFSDRLNGRLIQKETQKALVSLGFDKTQVENDVQVLETNNKNFKGKFATFVPGTSGKYTVGWKERPLTKEAHKSTGAVGSGELGTTGLELKLYNGAASATDDVPEHIDFAKVSKLGHMVEATKVVVQEKVSPGSSNMGAENAADYKNKTEQR